MCDVCVQMCTCGVCVKMCTCGVCVMCRMSACVHGFNGGLYDNAVNYDRYLDVTASVY